MKVGLGSNLTLEATINPDFGQIEADPAEVNLTVFETIFDERRPFFIEGNSVLEAGTSNFYYSRRIGARPTGPATGEFVDYPSTNTILGAAKLTGRTEAGTSLGVLGAVTGGELADTFNAGVISSVQVAPQNAVGRGPRHPGARTRFDGRRPSRRSCIGIIAVRGSARGGAESQCDQRRLRHARSFRNRTYEAAFNLGLDLHRRRTGGDRTRPAGERPLPAARRSAGIRLDPTRRSLGGAQITGSFNKIAGRHWLWGSNIMIESPEFDPLDFGRLNYAGDYALNPRITYRETRPGRLFRSYSFSANVNNYWYFDADLGVRPTLGGSANLTFLNFWSTSFNVNQYFRGQDAQLTRGGPAMQTPLGYERVARRCATAAAPRPGGTATRQPAHERVRGSRADRQRLHQRDALSVAAVLGRAGIHRRERAHVVQRAHQPPVRHDAAGRTGGDLRAPLHLRLHRPPDALDAVPRQLHLQAGRQPRRVRGAVRGERSLQRASASSRCRARPRPAGLRHRRDDARARARTAAGR